jgi:NAD+ synthase
VSLAVRLSPEARPAIAQFLRAQVEAAGASGVVLGLSGGIDSALTARLARDALGPERVLGLLLPDRNYPTELLRETEGYAEALGIGHRTVPIGPAVEGLFASLPEVRGDTIGAGNLKARLRMIVDYAVARGRHALVLGTGNKSELLLGYFTKYGDGACDLLPIGDLYKTEVRALAEELGLPAAIREREPSAGLWDGQTDEEELGFSYAEADPILLGLEQLRSPEEIARETGADPALIRRIEERVQVHRHKRRLPPIPKLRLRTVGIDWRD